MTVKAASHFVDCDRKTGGEYEWTSTQQGPYDFSFLIDAISVPYLYGTAAKVWKRDDSYSLYTTISDPPYISIRCVSRSPDNYIYLGGGQYPDTYARPTKLDSTFTVIADWPAYTDWGTGPTAIIEGITPSWDSLHVYVVTVSPTPLRSRMVVKLTADTGDLVWKLEANNLDEDLALYHVGVDENENIFTSHWRGGSFKTPAVLDKDGTLVKDYYTGSELGAGCNGRVLRAENKWYMYGGSLSHAGNLWGWGIMQCYDDDAQVWDLEPWGVNASGGKTCNGAVYNDGFLYLAINTATYGGGSKNCFKVNASTGAIVASAYLGAANGQDVIKTPEGQLIFCTTTKFIEIDTNLNVLITYNVVGIIYAAEFTPDWYDYYSQLTTEVNLQTRHIAYPAGYYHLEGELVQVLGDGIYLGDEVVVNGQIALDDNTTVNHVGLKYTSALQPMKLDGEVNVKRISKLIPDFNETVGGEYGEELTDMYSMQLRASGDPMDRDEALHTGYVELPFKGSYNRQGDIWITQEIPLGMRLLGIGIDLSEEEV